MADPVELEVESSEAQLALVATDIPELDHDATEVYTVDHGAADVEIDTESNEAV